MQIKEAVAAWAMGTGTVPRLLGRRAGGKGVSADSGRLFLPWFGGAAARSEAAQKVILRNETERRN